MMNQAIPSPSERPPACTAAHASPTPVPEEWATPPSSVRPTEPELPPFLDTNEARSRPWLPRGALLGASLLILISLGLMLFPVEPRLILLIASLLPPLLAWLSYLLINKRATCERVQPRVPTDLEPAFAARAQAIWSYELERARWSLSRAEVFAGMWGMITSLSIAGATFFIFPASRPAGEATATRLVAFAVIGATLTSFLLDLARLSIRTSNDDPTKRMFAEALRTLILCMVSASTLLLLPRVFSPSALSTLFAPGAQDASVAASGIGAGVAIAGPVLFEWLRERFASVLGIDTKRPQSGTPLNALDDLSEAEIARLTEEGIVSVEALVGVPIPRLALNTRFSLQRVVEWHDQGLLITRVGAAPAKELRTRWGLRSSTEIRRILLSSSAGEADVLRNIFQKVLRVDSDAEADLVLSQIARDERIALTDVLRGTRLEIRRRTSQRPAPATPARTEGPPSSRRNPLISCCRQPSRCSRDAASRARPGPYGETPDIRHAPAGSSIEGHGCSDGICRVQVPRVEAPPRLRAPARGAA
jgi:hypothetical protein